jgi:protocatechuate 3,4-dioxygenase alpha subunit
VSTPGQTVGPFFSLGLAFPGSAELVPHVHPTAIRLHGRVLDGHDDPVPDALLEIWQPGADGRVVQQHGSRHRDGWTFTGWGRAATDPAGHYTFTTAEPGPAEPGRAPFVAMTVFARGLLDRLFTRVYLPGAADPFLDALPPDRRATLVATRDSEGLRFDVVLQGERETVFLAHR